MSNETFKFHSEWPTNACTFYDKKVVEIMRVSAEGVTVSPDIPADEAARAVLSAMDRQIKQMVEQAVAAEREACIDINAMHGGSVEVEAAIRARGEK